MSILQSRRFAKRPPVTVDNTVPRFDGIYGSLQTSGVTIDDNDNVLAKRHYTFSAAIADDAATSFAVPTSPIASMLILVCSQANVSVAGVVIARPDAGAFATVVVGQANLAASTGVLSGTTGTDTKFTVSPHSDGRIYVENRTGTSTSFSFAAIC